MCMRKYMYIESVVMSMYVFYTGYSIFITYNQYVFRYTCIITSIRHTSTKPPRQGQCHHVFEHGESKHYTSH